MTVTKKFVTDEYHEGHRAYEEGKAITTNPYLGFENSKGQLWYWIFGWQDAMAADVRWIKSAILLAGHSTKGPVQ